MACAARPKATKFHTLKDFEAMPPVPDFVLDELNFYRDYPASETFKKQLQSALTTDPDKALWLGRALYDRQIQGWVMSTRDVTEVLFSVNVREYMTGYVDFIRTTMKKAANMPIDEMKAQRLFAGKTSYQELDPTDDEESLVIVSYMLKGSHQLDTRHSFPLNGFLREMFQRHIDKIEQEERALTDVYYGSCSDDYDDD